MLALSAPWRRTARPALQRLSVELGADVSLATPTWELSAILSPDGQTLAFVAEKGGRAFAALHPSSPNNCRPSRCPEPTERSARSSHQTDNGSRSSRAGTEEGLCQRWRGGRALRTGGAGRGGFWTEDDTIVFQPIVGTGGNLARVSSAGGTPEPLLTLANGEVTQRGPKCCLVARPCCLPVTLR